MLIDCSCYVPIVRSSGGLMCRNQEISFQLVLHAIDAAAKIEWLRSLQFPEQMDISSSSEKLHLE